MTKNFLDSILVAKETFNYSDFPNSQNKGKFTHLDVLIITTRGSKKLDTSDIQHEIDLNKSENF